MTKSTTPDPVLDQIRERLGIDEYISEYLQLRGPNNAGEMSCKCPFHDDKSPSMNVKPTAGLFHCKGCGAAGDLFKFAMMYHQVDFRTAKEMLANRAGVVIEKKELDPVLKALQYASQRFQKALPSSKEAYDYAVNERKLKPETLQRFGVGFSNGFEFMKAPPAEVETLIKAGLLQKPKEADRKPFSLMTGRLVFTIRGRDGNVIAFGGRKMDEKRPGAKYVNTADSEYFKKSDVLFGMYEASKGIFQKGFAIVVEGYMDAAILHQEGATNTVAVMGASASEKAFEYLWSKTKRIVFCLDPDKAGQTGTMNSILRAASSMKDDSRIDILSLPDGLDPDEYVLANGVEAFEALCKNAQPLSSYLAEQRIQQESSAGKPFALRIPEDRTRFLAVMKSTADLFIQAPTLQAEIMSSAQARVTAFVCDAALKDRKISASQAEIRAAIEMLQQQLNPDLSLRDTDASPAGCPAEAAAPTNSKVSSAPPSPPAVESRSTTPQQPTGPAAASGPSRRPAAPQPQLGARPQATTSQTERRIPTFRA